MLTRKQYPSTTYPKDIRNKAPGNKELQVIYVIKDITTFSRISTNLHVGIAQYPGVSSAH